MNGHFLRPTTSAKSISWVSTIILSEKNLAPSKVGQTENFQTCLMDYADLCAKLPKEMVSEMHIKDNKNGKQGNFSFSKI